jgi:hypothetical protein
MDSSRSKLAQSCDTAATQLESLVQLTEAGFAVRLSGVNMTEEVTRTVIGDEPLITVRTVAA